MSRKSYKFPDFSKITIEIASPESILQASYGEVVNPKTITYKTYTPENGGLFCERIFGPVKDFTCSCGKYRGYDYIGMVCDVCSTAIVSKQVRRSRGGHIELVVPVVNPCFLKETPNRICTLLNLTSTQLEKIVYYEKYVVINPGIFAKEGLKRMDFISMEQYSKYLSELSEKNISPGSPDFFVAQSGGEAIWQLLKDLDIKKMYFELKEKVNDANKQASSEYRKKLNILRDFYSENGEKVNKPEWMVLKILPVIPADLRPAVVVDRIVVAMDLNELYKNVIVRNNRLKKLIMLDTPDPITRGEKRMIQEAVNALINGTSGGNLNPERKKYKSLMDLVKGKEGRFRQNLLGKRVDYSGRSVIVVNPLLKTYECGLPKGMAVEIFKPFIINKIIERGLVVSVIEAENLISLKDPVIYEIVEELLPGFPVMLNRAPTLHKMSIQSFQPKMIDSNAIQLSPLVCAQFNADFDGDQMALYVPLSIRAREEAFLLTLSANNLFKSSDGGPSFVPNMEMILGLYFLTFDLHKEVKDSNRVFSSVDELLLALDGKKISLHDKIKIKTPTEKHFITTTVGRYIFNDCLPENYPFVNETVSSTNIKSIISELSSNYDTDVAMICIDKIKALGFKYAYESGLSFKIDDLKIPAEKREFIAQAEKEVNEIENNYSLGFIDKKECLNQIISVWMRTVNVKMMMATTKMLNDEVKDGQFNSVEMMLKSGARGSKGQLLQTCGMRGLIAKSQKMSSSESSIIETPIKSNFKEGLTVLEYFVSTYGGRKGMVDTALKTAEAGYLTRKLVDVAQNIIVREHDCGTRHYIKISKIGNDNKIIDDSEFKKTIMGRICAKDVYSLMSNDIIIHKNEMFDTKAVDKIIKEGINFVYTRSVLTCDNKTGVCALCYGKSFGFNCLAQEGEPVGVIAAQSIGEPGTQLTLNTFHVGGVANSTIFESVKKTNYDGQVAISNLQTVKKDNKNIVVSSFCEIKILQKITNILQETFFVPYGAVLCVSDKQEVHKGDALYEIDPYSSTIIALAEGVIEYKNFEGNIVLKSEKNNVTNSKEHIVSKVIHNNNAHLILHTKDREYKYNVYANTRILVENGQKIREGDSLMKNLRKLVMSYDITGGLPRVSELFEVKSNNNPAILSDIVGVVRIEKFIKNNVEVIVESSTGDLTCKYLIPEKNDILVQDGDYVKNGTPLCVGNITASEIFKTKGFFAACSFLLSEIKSVYKLQGIIIPDKHIEIIIKQMFSFVEIVDPGDTSFIKGEIVSRSKFIDTNTDVFNKNVIVDNGDCDKYSNGQTISAIELEYENFLLQTAGKDEIKVRQHKPAMAKVVLLGISQVSLKSDSFLAAASFQFTADVLMNAAVKRKTDYLTGIKENVVVGHKIPAGTGFEKNIIMR
ncbi:MAG: DNA-directed RNA polymerase subunit beta' [Cytophagales bacterium]|nr:DNA-directed RNA polymerase subunit beta' [Cytophagales bacterium]